ncbi:MAG: transketolase [Fimbriimonas sp.]
MVKVFRGSVHTAARARANALRMVHRARASHIGAALSMIDLLAVLYDGVLRVDPANPQWAERDRLIVSKGHAAVGLYAMLAEHGFLSQADLDTYGQEGSVLLGHVSHHVPGVELSTGSLGHGLPVGCGLALAMPKTRVVVLCGDGEMAEGSVWEALLFAAHHRLTNLTLIVDANGIQGTGSVAEVLDLGPLPFKLASFGWNVRTIDGHDHGAIREALATEGDQPLAIVAHTVKGKGVDFMEDRLEWHYRSPDAEQLQDALRQVAA